MLMKVNIISSIKKVNIIPYVNNLTSHVMKVNNITYVNEG